MSITKQNINKLITVIFPSPELLNQNIDSIPNNSLVLVKSDINNFLNTNISTLIDDNSSIAEDLKTKRTYSINKIVSLLQESKNQINTLKSQYNDLKAKYDELLKKVPS